MCSSPVPSWPGQDSPQQVTFYGHPKVPSRVDLGVGQILEGKNGCGWSHPQVPAHCVVNQGPNSRGQGAGQGWG